jgi:hypothetical protein
VVQVNIKHCYGDHDLRLALGKNKRL